MSNDSWETPQDLFDELNEEFNFTQDLCAASYNKKCRAYFNDLFCGASYTLFDHVCWMNPPYSNPKPFVQRAWDIAEHNLVVCLLKCDPSTQTWAIFWDYEKHQPRPGCQIRFFPKRIKFTPPVGVNGKSGPTFPSCLVIMDRRHI